MRIYVLGVAALSAVMSFGTGAQHLSPSEDARAADIANRLVPIRSIAPDDEDFSDLMPLVERIGSARVVALGEATHGDGAAFHAKARLIRFLHQVMGFDVLAWESGILACHQMDVAMRTGAGLAETITDCGRPAWGRSTEARSVFDYVLQTQKTKRPMASAGFDSQFSLQTRQRTEYPRHITEFFDRLDATILSEAERTDLLRLGAGLIYADFYYGRGARGLNTQLPIRLRRLIDAEAQRLRARFSPREISLTRQMLDSMIGFARWLVRVAAKDETLPPVPHRDVLMAENVLWLAREYYPNRKIILWSHNYHVMNDVYTAPTAAAIDQLATNALAGPMGRHVKRELGRDYYSVGFFGYAGAYGTSVDKDPTPIPPAPRGTLAALIHRAGPRYAWLDLATLPDDHWLREPAAARFYFWDAATTVWPRIYDAAFYIERMYRSTPIRSVDGYLLRP